MEKIQLSIISYSFLVREMQRTALKCQTQESYSIEIDPNTFSYHSVELLYTFPDSHTIQNCIANDSARSKLAEARVKIKSLADLMKVFNSSSGKRHLTNFNYMRNHTIFQLKQVIDVLKSVLPETKSLFLEELEEILYTE